jgi:iron complex outermembrane receptor protein
MIKIKPLACVLVLTIGGTGSLAHAELEEVVVTATKRSASLQDVPVAVNAFTSDMILEAGIQNSGDLAINTPSLTVTSNSSPFNSKLSIRGVGTPQNDPALEPSVGLFVDGVFLGRSGLGMSDLTDIERIEVLQGPQGTLYGKNTNAGAISVITKRPNLEEFEGYVETTAGNYNMGQLTSAVSGPLSDTVAFRLSGNVHQRDGYLNNSAGNDLNDADDWNVQGKLLWEPSDSLSILLSGSHLSRDTKCCGADSVQSEPTQTELALQGLPQDKNDPYDYKIAVDKESSFDMDSDLVYLHIDYELDWATVTSISSWNDYDYTTDTDGDRSQLDVIVTDDEYSSGESWSQELRLTSNAGDNFDYQLGLFYYTQEIQRGDGDGFSFWGEDFITIANQQGLPVTDVGTLAQPGDYVYGKNVWDSDTYAVFGQTTWHLGERWHMTGGLRWTYEEREADLFTDNFSTSAAASIDGVPTLFDITAEPIDATLDRSSYNVDWLLKAAYDVGDNSMVYISASTGTKSGNFNGVNGTAAEREFDDESTLGYELGLKSTLLNNTLRFNAAAFLTEIDDYQNQQGREGSPGSIVVNEGEVEVSGIDLQLEAQPLSNLSLTAGLLYLHKYEVTDGPSKGRPLNHAAEYSGNLGATLVFPLADGMLFLRGDYIYQDDHVTTGGRNIQDKDIQDREIVNARTGWRNEQWNLSIWGKNLTEDEYASVTPGTSAFSGQDAYFLTPPRTYGATVRYDF